MLFDLIGALSWGGLGAFLAGALQVMVAVLVAIDVHEFAHAWAADRLGDSTARELGRLTLNPLAHLDPLGTLMLLVAGFGWGKPVPVNPYRLRGDLRRAGLTVSLAGPLANLLAAAVLALPLRLESGLLAPYVRGLFELIVWVNVVLAVFNLLPIPPLDGFSVLLGIVPQDWAARLAAYQAYGPMLLLLLLLAGRYQNLDLLGLVLMPITRFFVRAFVGA